MLFVNKSNRAIINEFSLGSKGELINKSDKLGTKSLFGT
jgi:hypothetical protein